MARRHRLPKKVSFCKGVVKEETRGDWRGCQPNLFLQKWEWSQKKVQEKDKSADKEVQTEGKRGTKDKQAKVANQESKEDLPAENGEIKNEESPASDEAGEREAESD